MTTVVFLRRTPDEKVWDFRGKEDQFALTGTPEYDTF